MARPGRVFSNPYLLAGIGAEIVLAAMFVYPPPLQQLLGTAPLPLTDLAILLPYPLIVWGADELRRYVVRKRHPAADQRPAPPLTRRKSFTSLTSDPNMPDVAPFHSNSALDQSGSDAAVSHPRFPHHHDDV
ncbi:cation transporting ATPase C-terminal domain-containing protein [Nocardia nova]